MWNRKELKLKAKKVFHAHYWKSVLAALIMLVIVGGFNAGSNSGFSFGDAKNQVEEVVKESVTGGTLGNAGTDVLDERGEIVEEIHDFVDEFQKDTELLSDEDTTKVHEAIGETFDELEENSGFVWGIIAIVFVVIMIVSMIIAFVYELIRIFAINVFEIGGRKFFVENHDDKASFKNFLFGFSHGYWKSVKVMFLRDLFTFLWTLLFIIPGFVKAYEYRMIPYLVAEHPEMTSSEAFAKSKEMMKGNKWAAFVLDLSFIGWHMLNGLTLGTLGLFHVNPYVYQTEAELYIALRDIDISKQAAEGNAIEYADYVEVE